MGLVISEFIANIANPAKPFLWDLNIPKMPFSRFTAQTAQFPAVGSTDIDLYYQGQLIKFAGAVEYEHTWTISIIESEQQLIMSSLYIWRQLVNNQLLGVSALPSVYKDICEATGLSSQGLPWIQGTLEGVYPKNIDAVELDRSANTEAWKWNVTFNFDQWNKTL